MAPVLLPLLFVSVAKATFLASLDDDSPPLVHKSTQNAYKTEEQAEQTEKETRVKMQIYKDQYQAEEDKMQTYEALAKKNGELETDLEAPKQLYEEFKAKYDDTKEEYKAAEQAEKQLEEDKRKEYQQQVREYKQKEEEYEKKLNTAEEGKKQVVQEVQEEEEDDKEKAAAYKEKEMEYAEKAEGIERPTGTNDRPSYTYGDHEKPKYTPRIVTHATAYTAPVMAPQYVPPTEDDDEEEHSWWLWIILIVIAVVVVFGCMCWVCFQRSYTKPALLPTPLQPQLQPRGYSYGHGQYPTHRLALDEPRALTHAEISDLI